MNIEEIYDFELKYQEVYKGTKDYTRNDFVIELIKKEDEKQELIDYLKEQINECKLSGNDEDYVRADVYEEILSKIEKR